MSKAPRLDRIVIGIAVAVPVTLIVAGGVFVVVGATGLLASLCGGGTGAVCGLVAQRHLVEVE